MGMSGESGGGSGGGGGGDDLPRFSYIDDVFEMGSSFHRRRSTHVHNNQMQQMDELAEQIAAAAADAAAVATASVVEDPIRPSKSLLRKERTSLRSRRRRRILNSARNSIVKLARNKFEQDQADVLNIYAKVNGGEILDSNRKSYIGI